MELSEDLFASQFFDAQFFDSQLPALQALGFSLQHHLPALQAMDLPAGDKPAQPWRLIELQRDGHARLQSPAGLRAARVLPGLIQVLHAQGEQLAVGDWLLARENAQGELWAEARLPPFNSLSRRDPEGFRQALVNNVDLALLVMGLDHDFKLARLDRYLVLTHAAELPALLVLSKADLCPDLERRLAEVRAHLGRQLGSSVLEVLALDGRPESCRAALHPWLGRGQTLVLLGSSGAGKSTLSNALCAEDGRQQLTGAVRLDDSRGRHTTTTRSLRASVAGACIIDTPGLRSLQLDADVAAVRAAFDDVSELAQHCRFRNCSHSGEPGCAVVDQLSAARVKSFHKLQREAERDQQGPLDRRHQLSQWKAMVQSSRMATKLKRG